MVRTYITTSRELKQPNFLHIPLVGRLFHSERISPKHLYGRDSSVNDTQNATILNIQVDDQSLSSQISLLLALSIFISHISSNKHLEGEI